MNRKGMSDGTVAVMMVLITLVIIGGMMYGWPRYHVYSQTMNGKADLREAEWSRQIAIEEAGAELEASKLKKQTDIIRAEGIAEANRIISRSLTKEYIQWRWVEGLHDGSSEVIYIATEAGIPIIEARG